MSLTHRSAEVHPQKGLTHDSRRGFFFLLISSQETEKDAQSPEADSRQWRRNGLSHRRGQSVLEGGTAGRENRTAPTVYCLQCGGKETRLQLSFLGCWLPAEGSLHTHLHKKTSRRV